MHEVRRLANFDGKVRQGYYGITAREYYYTMLSQDTDDGKRYWSDALDAELAVVEAEAAYQAIENGEVGG